MSKQPDESGSHPDRLPDDAATFPERELDDALSQAAALAADLSEDVGTPEPGDRNREIADLSPTLPRGAKPRIERIDMDQELSGLERAVSATAGEIGSAAGTSPAETKGTGPAVPDFMSEFTRPAQPSTPSLKPAPAPKPTEAAGSNIETAKSEAHPAPVATSTKPAAKSPAEKSPMAGGTAAKSAKGAAHGADLMGSAPGVVGNIAEPLSKLQTAKAFGAPGPESLQQSGERSPAAQGGGWLRLAERGVAMLERINRPFEWVHPQVRQLLGWVAIATMATSIIVMAAALTANW